MQEQINVLTKENDLLAEQQSSTVAELERTRQELTSKTKERENVEPFPSLVLERLFD